MAKSVLNIIIRTMKEGKADAEVIKGLTNVKSTVTSVMGAFAAFAGAAYTVDKALEATVGAFVDYAKEVRSLSEISGAGAEETSRLIQMAGDFFITTEQLTAATKALTKNGLSPTLDTMAMLSDEYLAIQDPVARAAFLTEKFGKAGFQMATMMATGGDGLRKMGEGVEANLILTQKAIDDAREYELAIEGLKGAWEDLTIGLGRDAIGPVTSSLKTLNSFILQNQTEVETAQNKWAGWLGVISPIVPAIEGTIDMVNASKTSNDDLTASLNTLSVSYSENAMAMQEAQTVAEDLAINYDKLLGSISNMQNETDRYNETEKEILQTMALANGEFSSGKMKQEEYQAIFAESTQKLNENAAAHKEWAAQTVFAFAQARAAADGEITEGEGRVLIDIGQKLGLFDEQTAEAMQSVNESFSNVDTSDAQATIDALNDSLVALTGRNWNITVTTTTVTETPTGTGDPDGYATGGAFRAGRPMRVEQDEILVPSYNGVVLTRTDAMRLMSGQGGGANNSKRINIYGLTIVAKGSVMEELDDLK